MKTLEQLMREHGEIDAKIIAANKMLEKMRGPFEDPEVEYQVIIFQMQVKAMEMYRHALGLRIEHLMPATP